MADEREPDGPRLTPGARRILDVASELFYRHGLHAVGVDTIAAESGVTKRTLYDRFGSKEALIAAYLQARDQRWRELVTARADALRDDPTARVLAPFDVLPDWLEPHGRGCAFVNAFAELPEPDHPGRRVIVAEKTWLRELFRELLTAAGAPDPDGLALQLLTLHEGALVSHSIVDEPKAPAAARAAAATVLAAALPGRQATDPARSGGSGRAGRAPGAGR